MLPDDADVASIVHGGTILSMIEATGDIISIWYCYCQNGERSVVALAETERTDFLSPKRTGEVVCVSTKITYTPKHSVQVQVNVMSENLPTGTKKRTNKATMCYMALSLKNVDESRRTATSGTRPRSPSVWKPSGAARTPSSLCPETRAKHGQLQPVQLDPPGGAFGLYTAQLCARRCHRELHGRCDWCHGHNVTTRPG